MLAVLFAIWTDRSYLDMHTTVKSRIESVFSQLLFKDFFDHAYYSYLRTTNRSHFNEVTFLSDGRLMFDKQGERLFIDDRVNEIIFLNDHLHDNGTPFLYVRAPNKLQDISLLPIAFSDSTIISDGDFILDLLRESGLSTIDLRAEMENEGLDFYSSFFKGDHHWTIEKALWAFGRIATFINSEYGFSIDEKTWDPGHYEPVTIKRGFLGEEAQAVNAFHRYEDITALIPKFHTDFTVTNIRNLYDPHFVSAGSFIEVFTPKLLDESTTEFDYDDLNVVHRFFNRYENTEAGEKRNILLVMDSMGMPLASFFAVAFETVDNLYLVNHDTNYKIWTAIDKNDYDLVVFLLSDVVVNYEEAILFENDRLYFGRP